MKELAIGIVCFEEGSSKFLHSICNRLHEITFQKTVTTIRTKIHLFSPLSGKWYSVMIFVEIKMLMRK
jgi:hypothetical protein